MARQSEKKANMEFYALRMPPELLQEAKNKSGFIGLPRLIRILLTKFLRGEITITDKDSNIL